MLRKTFRTIILAVTLMVCSHHALGQTIEGDWSSLGGDFGTADKQDPFIQWKANDNDSSIFSWIWARGPVADGQLQFAHNSRNFMTVETDVPSSSLRLNSSGIGAGTTMPMEAFHVQGGNGIFPRGKILVEDVNFTEGQRELLRLKNNGGVIFGIENTDTGFTFNQKTDINNMFIMGNGNGVDQVEIEESTPSHAVHTNGMGVGINTQMPAVPFHVFSDGVNGFADAHIRVENVDANVRERTLMKLKNNGGVRFSLENSDLGSQWIILTDAVDTFSVRKQGPGTPYLKYRNNGQMRIGNSGRDKFTFQPNGNLLIAGTLLQASDKNVKENFKAISEDEILEKLAGLPITTWSFKSESGVTHLGPTSQDFRKVFGLGQDEKTIAPLDSIGVSLAAIKSLNKKLKSKDAEIDGLRAKLAEQKQATDDMKSRLEDLESMVLSLSSQQ